MATISEKIKQALASLEAVRKDLGAVDEAHAEVETVGRVLDGRRGELAETEQQLVTLGSRQIWQSAKITAKSLWPLFSHYWATLLYKSITLGVGVGSNFSSSGRLSYSGQAPDSSHDDG